MLGVSSELYPSTNEWGIPDLLNESPTCLPVPLLAWGSVARTHVHGGTWHFYVDDRRFAAMTPVQVIRTGCRAAVEPNYSVFDHTPRALALQAVYRKRRVARELQAGGVQVFVDLCMPHPDLALIGVPRGYRGFATRGWEARPEDVEAEYRLAYDHGGGEPVMLVYGGGPKVQAVCAGLPGTIYVRGRVVNG